MPRRTPLRLWAGADVARVDDLLVAALRRLPSKPDDISPAPIKKRYSEQMSELVAQALAEELRQRGMPEARPAPVGQGGLSGAERRLAGGIGAKKVDVTWATEESGLLLALSVKTINFRDLRSGNFQKNLTNRRADMLIEAVTLHRRFPYAVLCGLLFLDAGASRDGTAARRSTALNAHQRLRLFTGRQDPAGRDEQFERLYLILVDASGPDPAYRVTEVGRPHEEVQLAAALDAVVDQVAERNFDFYEALDGTVHKLSARAARGETADDSDVADVLVDLDDEAAD
jgi:hypothetical protein